MGIPRPSALAVGTLLLAVLGCLIGLVLSEIGYRAYLYRAFPERFSLPAPGRYFAAYNVSHWEFDEQFGYFYPAGRVGHGAESVDVSGRPNAEVMRAEDLGGTHAGKGRRLEDRPRLQEPGGGARAHRDLPRPDAG